MPLAAAACGRPKAWDQLWPPDREWLHCLQLSWGCCNPPGAPRTQLIFPLPPSSFIPGSFCPHSAFTLGLWCNKEELPQNLQEQNEVSIKEFGVLAPEAKCWFTENPVHCQVATKPGPMSSVHRLQPREMLSLLDSILSSLLRPVFPRVSAETAKLEMNNPSFLFFWLKAAVAHHRRRMFCTDPQGCRNPVEVDLSQTRCQYYQSSACLSSMVCWFNM